MNLNRNAPGADQTEASIGDNCLWLASGIMFIDGGDTQSFFLAEVCQYIHFVVMDVFAVVVRQCLGS